MSTLSGGPNVVMDGLVLWLDAANPKSYVSGSTTWNDISRTGVNGTLTNGPTFSSANGGSIVLDGVNDSVLMSTIPTSLFSLISSSFTVDMWVYVTNTNQAGLISSNQSATAGGQYHLIRRDGILQVSFYFGNTLQSQIPFPTGSWINVVHTYNYTNQTSSLYQQGVFAGTRGMGTPLITSASLYLGWFGFGGTYLSGSISSTKIYNRTLSPTEITQNYNALKSRFNLT